MKCKHGTPITEVCSGCVADSIKLEKIGTFDGISVDLDRNRAEVYVDIPDGNLVGCYRLKIKTDDTPLDGWIRLPGNIEKLVKDALWPDR